MTASILPFSRHSCRRRDGRLPGTGYSRVAQADPAPGSCTVESAMIAHPCMGGNHVTAGPTCREEVAGFAPRSQPAVTPISDPIIRVDCHNIAHAVRLPSGELDSRDGDIWWEMGGYWYVSMAGSRHLPRVVTIPPTIAALNERQARP